MVKITKEGDTYIIETDGRKIYFPMSSVILHADKDKESVDIKLRASRRSIISFSYKDFEPLQTDAYETVRYIASIV